MIRNHLDLFESQIPNLWIGEELAIQLVLGQEGRVHGYKNF